MCVPYAALRTRRCALATGRYINFKRNDVRPKAILNVVDAYRQLPKCNWNGFLFSSFGKFTRLFFFLLLFLSLLLLVVCVSVCCCRCCAHFCWPFTVHYCVIPYAWFAANKFTFNLMLELRCDFCTCELVCTCTSVMCAFVWCDRSLLDSPVEPHSTHKFIMWHLVNLLVVTITDYLIIYYWNSECRQLLFCPAYTHSNHSHAVTSQFSFNRKEKKNSKRTRHQLLCAAHLRCEFYREWSWPWA